MWYCAWLIPCPRLITWYTLGIFSWSSIWGGNEFGLLLVNEHAHATIKMWGRIFTLSFYNFINKGRMSKILLKVKRRKGMLTSEGASTCSFAVYCLCYAYEKDIMLTMIDYKTPLLLLLLLFLLLWLLLLIVRMRWLVFGKIWVSFGRN